MFLLSIAVARERVLIASAYFVPDSRTIAALVAARQRDRQVEVIVPGPYMDSKITRHAHNGGSLLTAGAAIYGNQPTTHHCKVMIIDDRWVYVGSTNFDNRSIRLNDAANLNAIAHELVDHQGTGKWRLARYLRRPSRQ